MSTYVLILIILFPGETGGTTTVIEFNSPEACQAVAEGYNSKGLKRDINYSQRYQTEISAKCWKKQ